MIKMSLSPLKVPSIDSSFSFELLFHGTKHVNKFL